MTTLKSELSKENEWYPPSCKAHIELLNKYCSHRREDRRDKLSVLTDIDYRVVTPEGSGLIRGFNHDRYRGELKLNIKTENGEFFNRASVPLKDIVKVERVSDIPNSFEP